MITLARMYLPPLGDRMVTYFRRQRLVTCARQCSVKTFASSGETIAMNPLVRDANA